MLSNEQIASIADEIREMTYNLDAIEAQIRRDGTAVWNAYVDLDVSNVNSQFSEEDLERIRDVANFALQGLTHLNDTMYNIRSHTDYPIVIDFSECEIFFIEYEKGTLYVDVAGYVKPEKAKEGQDWRGWGWWYDTVPEKPFYEERN